MLVLTRKPQEKIKIGDSITITVIKTKGKGVRLGIEAPADVSVLRGELAASRESFAEPESGGQQEGVVSFQRVSRSRVASVLPEMLGDAAPLREMLARRDSSPVVG